MDQFKDIALPLILLFEGSAFTNHPADRGGPTRYGIIQKVYDKYRLDKNEQPQTVERILISEVQDIYYSKYWVPAKCQDMPGKLSIAVFDTTVNSGQGRAVKILQQVIGAKVDGVIGKETIKKLKDFNVVNISNNFLEARESFYHAIVNRDATQSVFLRGWLRRIQYLREYIMETKTLEQIKREW